ncbi:MAG: choice-of-anchor D domain-containing protein [Nitrospirota bacterium]
MKKTTTITVVLAALILGAFGSALAVSGYLSQFNTRYGTSGTVLNTCSVCHTTAPALNSYGSAYRSNSHNFATIEPLDSDGDGFSNIAEINARTFPGNASSVPAASDTTLPTVTAFSIPSTSSSLTVAITTFTASDNVGVAGYIVNESSTKPSATATGWSTSVPTSHTFTSAGTKTLYAWAKDAAGNVSASRNASVTITLPPPSGGTHSSQTWTGTQQCRQCHTQQATDLHGSIHYQWQGQAPYTISGPPVQGKLNSAVNSYCISILGNWNVCGNCHAGLGAKPEATASTAQLANIDCLVCHQKDYKRKKVNGVFVPDTANMTITMDQAVQTVRKPVRANCLQCHAKAGGGDNNKRGDIALAHANTGDRNFDVHMSTSGGNLVCQSCHTTQNHRIAGRGSDLRETDLDVQINCTNCHTNKLSSTGHATADVNRHVKKVACQTCHIKTYARNASDTTANESTEMHRDWTLSEWSAANNRYEPPMTRGSDLKPEYAFWNGYSYVHNLGETAAIDPATGRYPTSRPEGGINDANSKLFPFKYKTALQPMATGLSKLIALDTSVFMSTGDTSAAVKQGLANMGLNSAEPYSFVETDTYQLITHEAMPSSQALSCNQCHGSTATQMNLKNMGYVLKGSSSSVCSQCHGYESNPGFTSVHNRHVRGEGIDCSRCHNFTRGSTPPPSPTTYTLSVTKSGTGSGTVTSSPSGISCGSDCSQSYSADTQVTLSATAASGSTFAGWSGNSDCADGVVIMNASKSCTAAFSRQVSQGVPDISVSPSETLEFGGVRIRSTKTLPVTVRNRGTGTLTVSKMEITGTNAAMFRVVGATTLSIAPSQSATVSVSFTPTSREGKSAYLRISSNDPDTPTRSIRLKGEGKL